MDAHDAPEPAATVVVPSRDRPAALARCVRALQDQETLVCFEIIIVDDGSEPPVDATLLQGLGPRSVLLIRRDGSGPACARNAGVHEAAGDVILFTDDDTIPAPGWVDAACSFLSEQADHVGVEGPTQSPPYDRLYLHGVSASRPGSFLTCNIAYRRSALITVGGFSEEFPSPHAEDLDLGFRIAKLGPVGFDERMVVLHPPVPVSLMSQIRRGTYLASDLHLYRLHPDRYPLARRLTPHGYALFLLAKGWAYAIFRDPDRVRRSPRRALRLLVLTIGHSGVGVWVVIRDAMRRTSHPELVHSDFQR